MHSEEVEMFDWGDRVRIGEWTNIEWFKKHDPDKLNCVMRVEFQDGNDVWTDKGVVGAECLELVED